MSASLEQAHESMQKLDRDLATEKTLSRRRHGLLVEDLAKALQGRDSGDRATQSSRTPLDFRNHLYILEVIKLNCRIIITPPPLPLIQYQHHSITITNNTTINTRAAPPHDRGWFDDNELALVFETVRMDQQGVAETGATRPGSSNNNNNR